jgi:membrane-bound serine protease (ClpP class)
MFLSQGVLLFLRKSGLWAAVVLAALLLSPGGAQAAAPQVLVLNAKGPVVQPFADYINRGIDQANAQHAEAVILVLDTPGGSAGIALDLVQKIRNSDVPVVVFVGPRGAMAASAGLLITLAGDASGMSPDTAIGAASPIDASGQDLPSTEKQKATNYLSAQARSLAEPRGDKAIGIASDAVVNARAVTATEAHDAKLVDFIAEDVNDLVKQMDGFSIQVKGKPRTLHTAGAQIIAVAMTPVEGFMLELSDALTDPNIVFLLLAVGVILIIIEISHPGGWVMGTGGVISLGLALYGLGILPVNWLGLVFIGLAFVLFVLDIKAPTHGILTLVATASLIGGAVILLGTPAVAPYGSLSIPLVVGVSLSLAALFLFIVFMAVRAQSRRPTTGMEGLIDQIGRVMRDIDPVGTVRVVGEIWQAESADGKAILSGESVEVVAIDGMRLRVRPHS